MLRLIYKENGILHVVLGKADCMEAMKYCRENNKHYVMDRVNDTLDIEKAYNNREAR